MSYDSEQSFVDEVEQCLKDNGCQTWREVIPDSHPAVIKLHHLHYLIKYKWLCSECHKKEHGYS